MYRMGNEVLLHHRLPYANLRALRSEWTETTKQWYNKSKMCVSLSSIWSRHKTRNVDIPNQTVGGHKRSGPRSGRTFPYGPRNPLVWILYVRQTVWQGEKSYLVGLRLRITSRKQAVYSLKASFNGLLSTVRPYDPITHNKFAIFLVCVSPCGPV